MLKAKERTKRLNQMPTTMLARPVTKLLTSLSELRQISSLQKGQISQFFR